MIRGVSNPMMVKGLIEDRLVNYKKIEEIHKSLRTISDEFKMGRLDETRHNVLKLECENEIKNILNFNLIIIQILIICVFL